LWVVLTAEDQCSSIIGGDVTGAVGSSTWRSAVTRDVNEVRLGLVEERRESFKSSVWATRDLKGLALGWLLEDFGDLLDL